jgi:hypothetical protein
LFDVLTEQPRDLSDVAVHREGGAVGVVAAQRFGDRFVPRSDCMNVRAVRASADAIRRADRSALP